MSELARQTEKSNIFIYKKVILTIFIATVIISVCIVSGACIYVSSYDRIYPGVKIMDTDIGGKTVEEAVEIIADKYSGFAEGKQITLECNGVSKTVAAASLGARVDIEKTVSTAYNLGRTNNFLYRSNMFFSKNAEDKEISLSIECHPDMIERVINEITRGKEIPVVNPSYEVTGDKLILHFGSSGIMVDRNTAKLNIEQALSESDNNAVGLIMENIAPAPFDVDKLYDEITQQPENAYYARNINEEIVVMPSVAQVTISKSVLNDAVLNKNSKDKYEIPVQVTLPNITADVLLSKMFRDKLATYTTYFNAGEVGRSSNVRNAANRINNHTLLPGEIFAYDKTLGPRTIANGFSIAHVYVGNKVEDGLGGGICQVSSTLYCAALYADLSITERHNHSLPVAYVPGGQDATIAEGSLDLRIKNNTEYPIKISAVTGAGSLTVDILGTKESNKTVQIINTTSNPTAFKTVEEYDPSVPVGTKRISQKGSNGFTVVSYRLVKENGQEVKNEFLSKSVYLPMDRIETVNPVDKGRNWNIPITSDAQGNSAVVDNETITPNASPSPDSASPPASAGNQPSAPAVIIDESTDIVLD